MAEIGLKGAGIVPPVCQGESAGVPQHVRVSLEPQFGLNTSALHHASKAGGREGRAALRGEHEGRATSEPPTEIWAIGGMKQHRLAIEALTGRIDAGAQHVLVSRLPARDQL